MDTASNEHDSQRAGSAPGHWCFAGFQLDEISARLRAGPDFHPLDHGSYGVLLALLQNAGQLVGKDDLLRAGWPGRVVSENSLTKAISRLRHLLEDPKGDLLCTAHGYGYRLAAQAEWLPGPAQAAPAADPSPSESRPPAPVALATPWRRRVLPWLAVAVLLASSALWATRRDVEPRSVSAPQDARVPDAASVAVLPFSDLSQGHDQRYFSDGLTDELAGRLAKLPQLRVASRTSTFATRDTFQSAQAIGRRLGVATVLEGSVRRDGERMRITVQLVNVNDGLNLWSETYDERVTDLFAVQDRIARSVVSALRLKLLPGQDLALTRNRTHNDEAFNAFLEGRRLRYLNTPDGDRRAIAAYERAIRVDPLFSTAYASLADVLGGDARYADSVEEVVAGKMRSLDLMDKAIALEPDRADFYLARADFLYSTRHDWLAAQRDLDTAARLFGRRPADLLARQCRLYAVLGRLDDAIADEHLALRGDAGLEWAWGQLGFHLAAVGRFDEAHKALAIAGKLHPGDDHLGYYDGLAWLLEGKANEAIEAFQRGGSMFRLAGLAAAYHDVGDDAASRRALQLLIERFGAIGAYQVAQGYAWRGDADRAFEWLDLAERQQDAGLMQMKFDPMMRRLHGDPRYRAWLLRLKLDDASLAAIGMAGKRSPGS